MSEPGRMPNRKLAFCHLISAMASCHFFSVLFIRREPQGIANTFKGWGLHRTNMVGSRIMGAICHGEKKGARAKANSETLGMQQRIGRWRGSRACVRFCKD